MIVCSHLPEAVRTKMSIPLKQLQKKKKNDIHTHTPYIPTHKQGTILILHWEKIGVANRIMMEDKMFY